MPNDNRVSVTILRHYRMYVPGDQGMFSPEETKKIVDGGFGKVTGSDAPVPNPNQPKALDTEGKPLVQGENVVQVEGREIGVNTEDPLKKRVHRERTTPRNRMTDTSGKGEK
jgi:hypothetical protein